MNDSSAIRHPGVRIEPRVMHARGDVRTITVTLPAGGSLMETVAAAIDGAGGDGGVMILDGLEIGPYRYVMPDRSSDGFHAAWYSEPHAGARARIRHATAIVGKRDGAPWLHCHAMWHEDGRSAMGHLLPDEVVVAEDATVTLHAFAGGGFEVLDDPETAFSIFHPTEGRATGNALIARARPHEDVRAAIEGLVREAGFDRARVFGIGSLVGARFEASTDMVSPISETLIPPGAFWKDGTLRLPMHCVDPEGGQFDGLLIRGGASVCVTFELMVVEV